MKRSLAGIMAVVLTMGVMTACGSAEQDGSLDNSSVNETGEAAPKSSDSEENNSQADESDDSDQAEEQGTSQPGSEPQKDDTDKEKETVSLDYDVVYFSEDEDPEGLGCQVKFSDKELNDRVETIIELARAIQQNDKEAADKIMNVDLGIEEDLIDEDEFTGSGLDDYFSDTKIGSYEFTADISNVKKTEVWQSTKMFGFTISTFAVYLDSTGDEQIILVAHQWETSDGIFTYIGSVMTETELKEERKNNDKLSALKDANFNAKTGYNIVAEALFDAEVRGEMFPDGQFRLADVDCTSLPSNEVSIGATEEYLIYSLQKNLGPNGVDGGSVYVISAPDSTTDMPVYYVQWRSSPDSDIIGQYPNCPVTVDDDIRWGEIY